MFLGTGARGAGNLEFPAHPNIRVKRWRFVEGGVLQKIHYILFGLWCFGYALMWRPNWIYASDPLICPIVLAMQKVLGVRVVYHEHDSPGMVDRGEGRGDRGKNNDQNGIFQKIVMGARREVARRAEVCVLPNDERVGIFKKQTGTDRPVECVWNVPGLSEIGSEKKKPDSKKPLKLFYGGSLSPERLPLRFVEEIIRFQGEIKLEIVGYPTYSAKDYLQTLKKLEPCSKSNVITYRGVLAERKDLLNVADQCDASLCLMPMKGGDLNMRTMAGASNKPFDAMARGLAVVVSELPHWTELYLEENTREARGGRREAGGEVGLSHLKKGFRIPSPGKGYGIAINPENRESFQAGLEWMLENREKLWEMGERGRQKIREKWNYQTKFEVIKKYVEKHKTNNLLSA